MECGGRKKLVIIPPKFVAENLVQIICNSHFRIIINSYSKQSKKASLFLETGCTNDKQELLFNEFFLE